MNTRSIWSLLLLAATLTTGSCSKENKEAPAPKIEFATDDGASPGSESGTPVFVVPGKTTELK